MEQKEQKTRRLFLSLKRSSSERFQAVPSEEVSRSNLRGVYGSPLAFLTSITKMLVLCQQNIVWELGFTMSGIVEIPPFLGS